MNKAQASVEFLTTYGFMILVAAMVAGALAYFGVFSTDQTLPQQCDLTLDFSCEKYTVRDTGIVRLQSINKIGEPVDVLSFWCFYPDGSNHQTDYSASPNNPWGPGDAFDLECDPGASGGLLIGERQQVDVRLEYRKTSGGFTKTVDGKIAANVN